MTEREEFDIYLKVQNELNPNFAKERPLFQYMGENLEESNFIHQNLIIFSEGDNLTPTTTKLSENLKVFALRFITLPYNILQYVSDYNIPITFNLNENLIAFPTIIIEQ